MIPFQSIPSHPILSDQIRSDPIPSHSIQSILFHVIHNAFYDQESKSFAGMRLGEVKKKTIQRHLLCMEPNTKYTFASSCTYIREQWECFGSRDNIGQIIRDMGLM